MIRKNMKNFRQDGDRKIGIRIQKIVSKSCEILLVSETVLVCLVRLDFILNFDAKWHFVVLPLYSVVSTFYLTSSKQCLIQDVT